jgi:hypothetical protein
MGRSVRSWSINVICGLLAYAASRLIWQGRERPLEYLHWELVTFAAFYLLLQALIRGRKFARRGKEP